MVSELKNAFASAREEGSILPVFEPFMAAHFFTVGAMGMNGDLNLALKASPIEGRLCATVSEDRECLQGVADAKILQIAPLDLLQLLGDDKDIVIVYNDGGDVLDAEYVSAFRDANS